MTCIYNTYIYIYIHIVSNMKIIGIYQDCQFPCRSGSHVDLCNIKATRQFTERIQVTREPCVKNQKKYIYGISVVVIGNALKRDHTYEPYICTADTFVRRSRDGITVCSPLAAPWFLSLPEMTTEGAVLSWNGREEMTASDIQREKETSVSFFRDLKKSKLADNAFDIESKLKRLRDPLLSARDLRSCLVSHLSAIFNVRIF